MSNTGITIFNVDTYEPVKITSVKPNAKQEHGDRLYTIREYLKELIIQYPPYEVAIERGFTLHNISTQVSYRVHGVINELFHEYKQFYYAPTTVKLAIAKNGKAKKDVVQSSILRKYPNIEFANQDESDAFAVGLTHLIKNHNMKWD